MTNYKVAKLNSIGKHYSIPIPSGAKVRVLQGASQTGTAVTALLDTESGANYIVPTGKKFFGMVLTIVSTVIGNGKTTLYAHTVASTAGGTIEFNHHAHYNLTPISYDMPPESFWNADDYVNNSHIYGASVIQLQLIGYETDA